MAERQRMSWFARDVSVQREGYLLRYTAVVLALALLGYGLWRSEPPLLGAGLLLLLLTAVLLGLQIWSGRRLALARAQTTPNLQQLSRLRPIDRLLSVDLGDHELAHLLARELTTGRLTVVDIYNPHQAPRPATARARQVQPRPANDPRLVWYNGSVNLLPLPDHSVRIVFLNEVLSDLAQEGDRRALLREVARVLEPNGCVVLAELADTWPLRLRAFPGGAATRPSGYWRALLQEAGLQITLEPAGDGLIYYLRADKVAPYAGLQLALDFDR